MTYSMVRCAEMSSTRLQVPVDIVCSVSNELRRNTKEVQHVADLLALGARMPQLRIYCGTGSATVYGNKVQEVPRGANFLHSCMDRA